MEAVRDSQTVCEGLGLESLRIELSWVPCPHLSFQGSHQPQVPVFQTWLPIQKSSAIPGDLPGGTHAVSDLHCSDKQKCLPFCPHELDPQYRQ